MRKRRLLLVLIIFLLIPSSALAQSVPLTNPGRLRYPPIRFKPPQAERLVLSNGMILYLLEDHELPLVNIHATLKTGSYFDSAGKEGLAELTGLVMRTGGTEAMSGSEIDETLESMAININIAMQMESCTINYSSLKNNLEQGLAILAQILIKPAFAEDKFQLAKNLKQEEIRRMGDDPQQFAFREFNRVLYRGDPRGRLPSLSSLGRITRDDLQRFHQRYFNPDNMMVAVTGDITKNEALSLLEKYFAGWAKKGLTAEIPPPPANLGGEIFYLPKDVPQSVIVTGRFAPDKNNADFHPFTVLDFVLGSGGFRSRVFQEIRTNQGLAYSVGSFYRARSDYGVFGTYAMTKSSTTAQVLSLLRSIVEKVKDSPISTDDLAWAKKSINNSFIFSFNSTEQIARQQMMLEYDRLPKDHLLKYQDRISKVGKEDIIRLARQYLSSGSTITLVMGKEMDFDKSLASFGKVEKLQVSND